MIFDIVSWEDQIQENLSFGMTTDGTLR